MKHWSSQISGCFSLLGRNFAGSRLHANNAYKLLGLLRHKNVKWREVNAYFNTYLNEKKITGAELHRELERIEAHFKPWLRE